MEQSRTASTPATRPRHTATFPTQGILRPEATGQKFQLTRLPPSATLGCFVEHYWSVAWDLRGQPPHIQETLPYPCAHLVFEAGRTHIFGVMTGRFTRRLAGQGRVLGVKFRPAGFYPFLGRPAHTITDRELSFTEVFGGAGDGLEAAILAEDDEHAMAALAEGFLRAHLPRPDSRIAQLNALVACIASQRAITSVEEVLAHCATCPDCSSAHGAISKRTLQRLFRDYIGVGPKWVIRRFRLHEAAGRIDAGIGESGSVNWSRIALELGYTDQTHFIKDFKALIGKTPAEYGRRSLAAIPTDLSRPSATLP
jgi:AraC-like DNA-binding protein